MQATGKQSTSPGNAACQLDLGLKRVFGDFAPTHVTLARTVARAAWPSAHLPGLCRPAPPAPCIPQRRAALECGHSRDSAKSTNSKTMVLEGRLSLVVGSKIQSYITQLCTEKVLARSRRVSDQDAFQLVNSKTQLQRGILEQNSRIHDCSGQTGAFFSKLNSRVT